MTDRIFLFGTMSGLIVICSMIAVFVATSGQPEMGQHSEVLGYSIMLVALSMIFFGVKSYRDKELGGVIRFLPAFMMGLGISVVAGVIYVLVWEVYMAFTHYTFMDAFVTSYIAKQKAAGVTGGALDKVIAEMEAPQYEANRGGMQCMNADGTMPVDAAEKGALDDDRRRLPGLKRSQCVQADIRCMVERDGLPGPPLVGLAAANVQDPATCCRFPDVADAHGDQFAAAHRCRKAQ
jgi:hypothetical protein